MLKEKGTLPIGIEYGGAVRRAFTIRPQKMRDSVDARGSEDIDRLNANSEHMGLYLLARRVDIAGLPKEAMTLDFMLDLWDDDVNAILAADGRLANAVRKFCGAATDAPATDAGDNEDGIQLSGSSGDGGAGGGGLAGCLAEAQESEGGQGKDVQGSETPEDRP